MPGSPVFNAWKELYALQKENQVPHTSQSLAKTQQHTTPMSSTQYHRSSSERVSPVLDEILVYPSAPDNLKTKPKKNKVTIPNFMTSETSMKILLDQKLKKARELAEKQKRLREREEKREAKKKVEKEKEKRGEEKWKEGKNGYWEEKEKIQGRRMQ